MSEIIQDKPQPETWTAARLKVLYMDDGKSGVRNVTVTLEQLQEEKRNEFRQQGATEDQVEQFVLDAETFQGMVYSAARQLATSPLFVKPEDGEDPHVRVLGPWHIVRVEVIPQQRNRILTPTQTIHVPQQRAN